MKNIFQAPRRTRRPFTENEVENLRAGVWRHGHSWKFISQKYRFSARTPQDLKDKWRDLARKTAEG